MVCSFDAGPGGVLARVDPVLGACVSARNGSGTLSPSLLLFTTIRSTIHRSTRETGRTFHAPFDTDTCRLPGGEITIAAPTDLVPLARREPGLIPHRDASTQTDRTIREFRVLFEHPAVGQCEETIDAAPGDDALRGLAAEAAHGPAHPRTV
jgi:hypothetical protein